MIAGVGGVVLIISLFLSWGDSLGGGSLSAFDLFSGVDIILLVIGIAAIAYAGLTAAGSAGDMPPYSAWILSVLGVLAFGFALEIDLEAENAGIGAWLALFSAAAIAFGGFMAASESGAAAPTPPRAPVR